MKPEERDKLLSRLDERTANIWKSIEKLEKHQETQNGHILETFTRSSRNSLWIKIVSGVGGAAILAFIGVLTAMVF